MVVGGDRVSGAAGDAGSAAIGQDRGFPMRAPALVVAVGFAVGIAADRWLEVSFLGWLAAAAPAGLCWLGLFGRGRDRFAAVALSVCVVAVGGARHHLYWSVRRVNDISLFASDSRRPVRLVGVMADEPQVRPGASDPAMTAWPRLDRTQCTLECRALFSGEDRRPVSGRALLSVSGHLLHAHAGDMVEVRGWLSRARPRSNPGGVDFAEYLRRRGFLCVVTSTHPDAVRNLGADDGYRATRMLSRIRRELQSLFIRELDPRVSVVASALLLGERSHMPQEIREAFAESGAMHLLAISGLHVGILAMLVWLICRVLDLSAGATSLLVIAAACGFAVLVEARAPVVRAAVLISICAAGQPWYRRTSWMNALAVCVLAVLAWNPTDLFDVGAQLSFLAVIAIFSASRWITDLSSGRALFGGRHGEADPGLVRLLSERSARGWLRLTLVTAAIWLATAPLVVARFHLVSAVGLLINVVLLPVVVVTLWLGFAMMTSGLLFAPAAWCFAVPFNFGLGLLLSLVTKAAHLEMSHVYSAGPFEWWLAGYYLLMAAAVFQATSGRRVRPVVSLLAAWTVMGLAAALLPGRNGELRCTVLAVGHGCGVLIELPNGKTVAYDAGSLNDDDYAANTVAGGLWAAGRSRLQTVVISHADVDHFNAVPRLLQTIPVGSVCVSQSFLDFRQGPVVQLCDAARRNRVPIQVIQAGDRLMADPSVNLQVLQPRAGERIAGDNANSVVLLVEFAGRRILLAGDLEGDGLNRLLAKPPVDVDVLLSPHHGSLWSNTPELAEWARPERVVVSTGRAAAAERLKSVYGPTAEILSTYEAGAVTVMIDRAGRVRSETVRSRR